jgi:nucleoside-diphosphate-sugar epimerase
MKTLVTGANGLLGHHVVMQLLDRGEEVRVIVRSSKNIFFDVSKVELYQGNFALYDQLAEAALGCDSIIHIAAITATDLLAYNDYHRVNVLGSKIVTDVAKAMEIKNIVFVSTANTVGYGSEVKYSNENQPIQYPFTKSFYARSKVEAERLFTDLSAEKGMHVVIINPAFMIGSYDTKPSSGKLLLMGYRKRFMLVPRGGKNFVAVTDVATAVCNALTMGRNGERYLAVNENLSFEEFYKLQSRVGEYRQKIILLPDFLLEIAGKAGDVLRFFGLKTDLCSMNLNQLMIREYYDIHKAEKELDMPRKELETAIKEALEWFRTNGYMKK